MCRFFYYAIALIVLTSSTVMAIREDKTSDVLQMDTNMSDMMSISQPDPSIRFLQTLTNQQQDIQNLNSAIQQNQQEAVVERARMDQRIDFFYLIFWCLIAINAFFLLIIIILFIKMKSLSNKIRKQPSIDSFLPPSAGPEPATFSQPKQPKQPAKKKQPFTPQKFDLSTMNEDEELDELLSSVKEDDIAALFPDRSNDNFFQHFQGEINRERDQLNPSSEKKAVTSDEDELLDELINEHFPDKKS